MKKKKNEKILIDEEKKRRKKNQVHCSMFCKPKMYNYVPTFR